ncbi:MAG: hypothetical protein CENE_01058 [Candidatus Celerinatantimonas neptuna]|nr:MAG: hypothetical protein CENE_01058 [Candidatus Celerinatantimonas neptuna]
MRTQGVFYRKKNECCLGIELCSEGLFAVLLEQGIVRYRELISLEPIEQWPATLWLYPQWLAQGLQEISQHLPRYQGYVSINLPFDLVHHKVLSFEGEPKNSPDLFRRACHKSGIETDEHNLVRYARLAPDTRYQNAYLFQVVALKHQIFSVLRQLCRVFKWHLIRLDLAAYSRARGWWALSDAWPGQRAELHVSKCVHGFEISLFLHKKLLDWRYFKNTDFTPVEQYLTQLPVILARFPGVKLYQVRSLDPHMNQFLSRVNFPLSIMTKAGDWQEDCQLSAYGAAIGGVQI